MADKHFKVKNNVQVSDLTTAGPVTVDANGVLASHTTLAIDKGGTGQTTAANAINALLPSQTNNTNKVLASDGTNVNWVNNGAAYQTSAPSSPNVGDLWVDSDDTGDSLDPYIIRRKTITATAGQTVFTTDVVFTDGYEQVYYNGVLLVRTTDYTTSGGTNTVTLLQGASAGDTIEIIASTPINLVNTATTSANTFTGFQTIKTSSNSPTTTNLKIINDGSGELLELYRNEATGLITRRYNGTYDSQTAVLSGQRFGFVIGSTYDGATYSNNSAINMIASENQTSTARGSYITFETTNTGTVGRSEKMRIDSTGNIGIGSSAPANTRLYVYNNDVSNPVQSVLHNANAGGSRYLLLGSSGANAGALTWDNNNGRLSLDSLTTAPLLFRTNNTTAMWIDTSQNVGIGTTSPNKKLSVAGDYNFSTERSYFLGQPTANVVSTGTNCYTIKFNRPAIYFKGIVFDVYMNGGKDWGGYGSMTYFGKMMVVFQSNTTPVLRMLHEYSSSYLNGNGFFTFNTYTSTYDNDYLYLTVKYNCSISSSDGHRPLMHIVTHDPQSYGDTSSTGANSHVNSIYAV